MASAVLSLKQELDAKADLATMDDVALEGVLLLWDIYIWKEYPNRELYYAVHAAHAVNKPYFFTYMPSEHMPQLPDNCFEWSNKRELMEAVYKAYLKVTREGTRDIYIWHENHTWPG